MSMNERAVMGGNLGNDAPDYSKMEVERIRKDYSELFDVTAPGLVAEATAITAIDGPETKGKVTSLIKRGRDACRRILAFHEVEKQPHYRRGQGVDQAFFGLHDLLAKRDKKGNDGVFDALQNMLTAYDTRVLAEEQERRQKEADEAARKEQAAREVREKAEREAQEKRDAAERARKPEKIEEKTGEADKAAAAASSARVEEKVAAAQSEDARIATMATPADIMRQRGDDGTLSTMGTEKFAEINDRNTLALEPLRNYFPLDALQIALSRYAASHGHSNDASVQITGARFGKRPKSVVR